LVEAARQNFLPYSEQIGNVSWTKSAATVVDDNTVAPDGALTADAFFETADATQHQLVFGNIAKAASALPFTLSAYMKPNGRDFIFLILYSPGTNVGSGIYFNVAAGTAGNVVNFGAGYTSVSGKVERSANGFSRVSITGTTDADSAITCFLWSATADGTSSYAGDITKGYYLWGTQLEQGALTSYVPTGATTMLRNADALTFPTIASPGTAIARVDGTMQEVVYATFNPVGHHVKDFREWGRTLSAAEISAVVGP
jgi:hypothetical protein